MKRARTFGSVSSQRTTPLATTTLARRRPTRSKKKFPFYGTNPRQTGFPDQLTMRHRYCENITVASTSGILQTYLFSCNGMYDPNITSTGQQPLYFDQVSALYDHYTVKGSKITITAAATGSLQGPQVFIGILKDDDTSTNYTSFQAALSDDMSRSAWGLTGGIQNAPLRLSQSWSAGKTYGVIPATDSTMSGTGSSNPSEQTYFRICVQEAGYSTTVTAQIMVEIEYYAEWRERKDVSIS